MFAGIDIGGTKLLAASAQPASDGSWELGPVVRRRTPPEDALATLVAMVDEALEGRRPEAIGVAVPGPFDRETGSLVDPPNVGPGWKRVGLREGLGRHYGCPVVVENDANCAALAEARWGAAAGTRTSVYMTVSTGIGIGVVADGRLVPMRHDTEGGHMVLWPRWLGGPPCPCGSHGCLEALASGSGIERRFGRRPEEIEDPAVWEEVGRWLGLACVNLTATHDCEAIVIGGGVMSARERFWPALEATLADTLRIMPAPRIAPAFMGVDRNIHGALSLLPEA